MNKLPKNIEERFDKHWTTKFLLKRKNVVGKIRAKAYILEAKQFLAEELETQGKELRNIWNKKLEKEVGQAIKRGNINLERMYKIVKKYKKEKTELIKGIEEEIEDHYWNSLEKDKGLIKKHLKTLLKKLI